MPEDHAAGAMSSDFTSMRVRVRRMVVAVAALLATGAAADPHAGEPLYPPRAIMILVASWCAPCRGELARLGEIAAAAGRHSPRVLAIDDSAATVRMLRLVDPALVWRPEAAQRARVRAALLARTAGLPYAAATDARGAICAEENGGLDRERTTALVRRCAAP